MKAVKLHNEIPYGSFSELVRKKEEEEAELARKKEGGGDLNILKNKSGSDLGVREANPKRETRKERKARLKARREARLVFRRLKAQKRGLFAFVITIVAGISFTSMQAKEYY